MANKMPRLTAAMFHSNRVKLITSLGYTFEPYLTGNSIALLTVSWPNPMYFSFNTQNFTMKRFPQILDLPDHPPVSSFTFSSWLTKQPNITK
jgi:hypothetical protein